jgi:O-antigen ligase
VLWSIDRTATLYAAAALICSVAVAADISVTFSIDEQVDLLAVVLSIAMVLSLAAELFAPGLIPSGDNASTVSPHGIFAYKNVFGRVICLTLAACMARRNRSHLSAGLLLTGALALALLSRSASAFGYAALTGAVFFLCPLIQLTPKRRAFALLCCGCAAIVLVYVVWQNFDVITYAVDKDPTLTGRTDLWRYSLTDIADRPWLGFGYEAFWTQSSEPARLIREAQWETAPHAHNGYIDMALYIGILGLGVYVALFYTYCRKAIRYLRAASTHSYRWPTLYLFWVLAYQFTESGIVARNTLSWILFCALGFSLSFCEAEASSRVSMACDAFSLPIKQLSL